MRVAYAAVLGAEPDLVLSGEAATAEDALDQLGDAPCDLVLTDYRLPGASGVALVERLRARRPGLPVLVITGHEEEAFEREARSAGAAGFLRKRDLHATLVPSIRAALGT